MKITISGFVHMRPRQDWEPTDRPTDYTFFSFQDATASGYILVCPASVEVEIPDTFNPVSAEVSALEAKKLEALEEYQRTVARYNERLSKLQAITNTVEAQS